MSRRRTEDPPRLLDDPQVSADDPARQAVELLTEGTDAELAAMDPRAPEWMQRAFEKVLANIRAQLPGVIASVTRKGGA